MQIHSVLIKPVITEKTTHEWEKGRYTFVVNKRATKVDVKNAVRELYGVNASAVNVRQTPSKKRIVGRGREITKRDALKKATFTVEGGKTIDIFKFSTKK